MLLRLMSVRVCKVLNLFDPSTALIFVFSRNQLPRIDVNGWDSQVEEKKQLPILNGYSILFLNLVKSMPRS